MQHLLLCKDRQVVGQTYYLGDYPEHSIQEWADLIRKTIGRKGKTPVFPISILWGLAAIGDLLKRMGWSDPPLTKFRLKNMLTGAHYPIEKTQKIVGELPFTLQEGVQRTLEWMDQQGLLRNKVGVSAVTNV